MKQESIFVILIRKIKYNSYQVLNAKQNIAIPIEINKINFL